MATKYAILQGIDGREVFYNFGNDETMEHTTPSKKKAQELEDKLSRDPKIEWAGIIDIVDG
jgi:hypothetical protein